LYADPGSGKSCTAAVIVEQFLDQGGTAIIFQPRSEWYTLKLGYPDIQIIGGSHLQDIPFTASHLKLYADAVVESGINLIFYTPDAPNIDKLVEFMSSFLDHLMKGLERRKKLKRDSKNFKEMLQEITRAIEKGNYKG
jgi:DNA helicase HerA-like ATPase